MGCECCCGNFHWYQHESIEGGWVCLNGESEHFTDFTEYGHACPNWEEHWWTGNNLKT